MKRRHLSRFCALFLSFILLISSFSCTATLETTAQQSHSIVEFIAIMRAIDRDAVLTQEQRVVLLQAILDNHLTVDTVDNEDMIYKSKYPLWVINKRLLVKGKTKLDSELIVKGKTRLHDRALFYKKAHFKDNIVVDGVASLNDAVIQNLDLAGG